MIYPNEKLYNYYDDYIIFLMVCEKWIKSNIHNNNFYKLELTYINLTPP